MASRSARSTSNVICQDDGQGGRSDIAQMAVRGAQNEPVAQRRLSCKHWRCVLPGFTNLAGADGPYRERRCGTIGDAQR